MSCTTRPAPRNPTPDGTAADTLAYLYFVSPPIVSNEKTRNRIHDDGAIVRIHSSVAVVRADGFLKSMHDYGTGKKRGHFFHARGGGGGCDDRVYLTGIPMHRTNREYERRIQSEEATREGHDAHGPYPRRTIGTPSLVPDGAPEEYGCDHVPSESTFSAREAHECGVSLVDATRLVDEERVGEM
jgi:hypothetical protein